MSDIKRMSDAIPFYRSCLTCGKLMALQEGSEQVYCSPECSRDNVRCPVCTTVFERGRGFTEGEVEFCSEDCAHTEPRYEHLFKESS